MTVNETSGAAGRMAADEPTVTKAAATMVVIQAKYLMDKPSTNLNEF
jgi:hypothetical protein